MVGFAPIRIGAEFDGNLPKVCSVQIYLSIYWFKYQVKNRITTICRMKHQ